MWHTPEGKRTFTGPYALVLAYGLKAMHEQLEYCYEVDEDDHEFGYRAFATLTLEQKVWALHKIAFGLLDKKTPIAPLVAYLEAGVATIFHELIGCVEVEIDFAKEDGEAEDWHFNTRRAILTVHEKESRNDPPFVEDDEEPLRLECDDIEQWKMAVEYLEDEVLWDADYEMESTADMPPEHDAAFKQEMGIADSYYNAIPNDPHSPQAIKLLKEVEKLCDRVISREEKKLKKTQ